MMLRHQEHNKDSKNFIRWEKDKIPWRLVPRLIIHLGWKM